MCYIVNIPKASFPFRHQNWDGLAQNVPVVGGVRYKLSAYIKLLNLENGSLYQNVDMIMMCLDANGNLHSYVHFCIKVMIYTKKRNKEPHTVGVFYYYYFILRI